MELNLLAGTLRAGYGHEDGVGPAARFAYPSGIATDRTGNVYVADTYGHTIRKITPDGVVSTVAGSSSGNLDGIGVAARFLKPVGITVDDADTIFVTDAENANVRRIAKDGHVTTLAAINVQSGSCIYQIDGGVTFNRPMGVVVDKVGNAYVADWSDRTIQKVTPDGTLSTFVGSCGQVGQESEHVDGVGGSARMVEPYGLAIDSLGNIFVSDQWDNTIRKVTPDRVVSTVAGKPGESGANDGQGTAARFNAPEGIAVDGSGNIYVADEQNGLLRKITPRGDVSTLVNGAQIWKFSGLDSNGGLGWSVSAVAVDSAATIYVADATNCVIWKITPIQP
jgi:sugar lactone lactonase YvrE